MDDNLYRTHHNERQWVTSDSVGTVRGSRQTMGLSYAVSGGTWSTKVHANDSTSPNRVVGDTPYNETANSPWQLVVFTFRLRFLRHFKCIVFNLYAIVWPPQDVYTVMFTAARRFTGRSESDFIDACTPRICLTWILDPKLVILTPTSGCWYHFSCLSVLFQEVHMIYYATYQVGSILGMMGSD